MKRIDLETWDRKEHFLFFRRSDYAHYHIGTNIDITRFKRNVKEQRLPFSFAMTYIVTEAMNEVESFRYRIANDGVILHKQLNPYFSYLAPDKKYFKMVLAELGANIAEFSRRAQKKALSQEDYFIPTDTLARSDLIFISSFPTVAFTHLSHTMTLSNKDDAIPRLSWGKYYGKSGKFFIPLNVQAHHAFVDGEHMGLFFDTLQEKLHSFK